MAAVCRCPRQATKCVAEEKPRSRLALSGHEVVARKDCTAICRARRLTYRKNRMILDATQYIVEKCRRAHLEPERFRFRHIGEPLLNVSPPKANVPPCPSGVLWTAAHLYGVPRDMTALSSACHHGGWTSCATHVVPLLMAVREHQSWCDVTGQLVGAQWRRRDAPANDDQP
jgi:hypothetical protein